MIFNFNSITVIDKIIIQIKFFPTEGNCVQVTTRHVFFTQFEWKANLYNDDIHMAAADILFMFGYV